MNSPPPRGRDYDITLFGATGFTGALTADYLARHGPEDMRWAIVGRNAERLAAIAERLAEVAPQRSPVAVLHAESTDAMALGRIAASSRVVASTVGPFMEHGHALVGACTHAGTDYLDITGEPEFVDRMWLAHQDDAERSGARLVHACGFDSVPHDLGVWFTLRHLPDGAPLSIAGYVRVHAGMSAGTFHSAIRAFGRTRQSAEAAGQRRRLEGRSDEDRTGRRVGSLASTPRRVPGTARWAVPLPTIDPIVIRRSARALDRYGPDFCYGHFADVGGLPLVAATVAGAGGLMTAAQIPPLRAGLLRLKSSGEGPDERRRSRSWFRVRFVSTVDRDESAPLITEVSGGDPGYDETSKMLAEAALSLAFDGGLPEVVGQLTPVQAMGDALLGRLQRAGMDFRTVLPKG